jgi:hypothetical protein
MLCSLHLQFHTSATFQVSFISEWGLAPGAVKSKAVHQQNVVNAGGRGADPNQCRAALRDQNVRHNRTMELGTVIDALYQSEINCSIARLPGFHLCPRSRRVGA